MTGSMFDWFRKTPAADAVVHRRRGNDLLAAGRLVEAEECYRAALAIAPDSVETCIGLGFILIEQGRQQEAHVYLTQAVETAPDNPDALYLLGTVSEATGDQASALKHFTGALALKSDFDMARRAVCRLLLGLSRLDEALEHYRIAVSLAPADVSLHNDLGALLQRLGRFDDARRSYRRALSIQPDTVAVLNNLASLLHEEGRYEEALEYFGRALLLQPDSAELHFNIALSLQEVGRREAAIESYGRATALAPDFAAAHWNQALCYLQMADFAKGWKKYEWRWKYDALKKPKPDFEQPLWLGDASLEGKTILLYSEQGIGDAIQFYRYTALLSAQGAKVLMQVPGALTSLLANQDNACKIISKNDPVPPFDCYCPLLSLGLAFGTTLETLPTEAAYLRAPADTAARWQTKLGPVTLPRIGLVWSGSALHANDRHRSIPLSMLARVISNRFHFVSLQKDVRSTDLATLKELPTILHAGEELEDFADTAGLIANLDIVLSVDTSVAHLAGAMGKSVWILLPFNPDWRWMLERTDSPWYPSARLFRQPKPGDWDSVMAEVTGALDTICQSGMQTESQ
jgi:tetratricopeptide (TPR) repeat protein